MEEPRDGCALQVGCTGAVSLPCVGDGTCSRTNAAGATTLSSTVPPHCKHSMLLKPPGIHSEFFVRQ